MAASANFLGYSYGLLLSLFLRLFGLLTDCMPGHFSVSLLCLLEQHSLATVFWLLRLESLIRRLPLPPGFGANFKALLVGVKRGQVKWLAEARDRTKADPVILYLHGGGYGLALQLPQALAMRDVYAGVGNPRLSILILQYTTSVFEEYPRQLQELAEVYNALSQTCENIILLGDSAGGQLALQLMRHAQAPELNVPHITQKPAAFVAISPAVDMNPFQGVSTIPDSKFDIHSVKMMNIWPRMISSDAAVRDGPAIRLTLDRSTDWSAALPPPDRVLIAFTDREILADSIREFIELSGVQKRGVSVYVSSNDFHASLCYAGALSPMMKPVCDFLKHIT